MKKLIGAALLVLASIGTAPAQAETADDIYRYFDILWKQAVPPVDACESGHRMTATCGRAADKLVCTANAIYVGLEESRLADRFPRQLSGLKRLLSEKADYLNDLHIDGHMRNPARMKAFEMRDFCRNIGAPLVP